jgi:hypothetical protein
VRSLPRVLDFKRCLESTELLKMIRPPLLSLAPLLDLVAVMAPLRDPVAVLPAAAAQDAHGPINSYWRSQGLAHRYHTYAATLQEHYISPHQVLLDSDIDHFSHPDAGPALMSAAGQFLPEPSSDADESA